MLDTQVVCGLSVSFGALDNATSYTASVTRADGSVIDVGAVSPGGSSIYVPYVGAGTYTVRVTAYGLPEGAEPTAKPTKIATAVARTDASRQTVPDRDRDQADGDATELDSSATPRSATRTPVEGSDLETSEDSATCADPAPAAAPASEPLPEAPPQDLDPENPDEDADGVPDADEQAAYDRAVAEQQAQAEAATQAAAQPSDC